MGVLPGFVHNSVRLNITNLYVWFKQTYVSFEQRASSAQLAILN